MDTRIESNESAPSERISVVLSLITHHSFKKLLEDFVSLNILFLSLSSIDIVPLKSEEISSGVLLSVTI